MARPDHSRWACAVAAATLVAASQAHDADRVHADGFERTITTGCASGAPPVPEDLSLYSPYADLGDVDVMTRGIWAVWWYPQFDHASDAEVILDRLERVRCNALGFLAMRDPPNPERGRYYNVYIHHGIDDPFPDAWGNGQGTDSEENPFLTLPSTFLLDRANLDHEGFHVFQYSADSPGFTYGGDAGWYAEASAQWYMSTQAPLDESTFVQIGTIDSNPHVALWHGWQNAAPGDPTDWNYTVRQYGMHSLLHYLTVEAGVPLHVLSDGFYAGTLLLPQEYLFTRIGPAALRTHFADWAAANTAGFPYLTPEQVARARQEFDFYADPANVHPYVASHSAAGTNGALLRPPAELAPRGWAYNVIAVDAPSEGDYTFLLQGDATGSEGAVGEFAARVVVMGPSGASYATLAMSDPRQGTATVAVPAGTTTLFLVVVALPDQFTGNQTYGYWYSIGAIP